MYAYTHMCLYLGGDRCVCMFGLIGNICVCIFRGYVYMIGKYVIINNGIATN